MFDLSMFYVSFPYSHLDLYNAKDISGGSIMKESLIKDKKVSL